MAQTRIPGRASARPDSVYVLASSAVAASGPANVSENIVATVTIPAGAMGLNGSLRINAQWAVTNDASVKTARIRLGGIGGTVYLAQVLTSVPAGASETEIHNRGAANSQCGVSHGVTGLSTAFASIATSAIDTSADTTLVFTVQKADGTDTMTLERYVVEVLYRA